MVRMAVRITVLDGRLVIIKLGKNNTEHSATITGKGKEQDSKKIRKALTPDSPDSCAP